MTIKQEMDEATGQLSLVVIDYKEDLHPQVIVANSKGEPIANYPIRPARTSSWRRETPSWRQPDRQDPESRQDQGHYRWSAACCGVVRGTQAEGWLRDFQDRR